MILDVYPSANVIVMNGEHFGLYTKNGIIDFPEKRMDIYEPSKKIEYLIRDTSSQPTFVTGFYCLGMSVTLINEHLGNFDNVVMYHTHHSDDVLYQLCRFLFNYTSWSSEAKSKIKATKFYSITSESRDRCLQYEVLTTNIMINLAGESRTQQEITGIEDPNAERNHLSKLNRQKRDLILNELGQFATVNWQRIPVFDKNDTERWDFVRQSYLIHRGKELGGRVMPKQNELGFYLSSLTKQKTILSNTDIKKFKQSDKWNSLHDLCMQTTYARIFVGYDVDTDSTDYTIWMKQMTLENTERVLVLLNEYKTLKREYSQLNTKIQSASDTDSIVTDLFEIESQIDSESDSESGSSFEETSIL